MTCICDFKVRPVFSVVLYDFQALFFTDVRHTQVLMSALIISVQIKKGKILRGPKLVVKHQLQLYVVTQKSL